MLDLLTSIQRRASYLDRAIPRVPPARDPVERLAAIQDLQIRAPTDPVAKAKLERVVRLLNSAVERQLESLPDGGKADREERRPGLTQK